MGSPRVATARTKLGFNVAGLQLRISRMRPVTAVAVAMPTPAQPAPGFLSHILEL